MDLAFVRDDLDALAAYFASQGSPASSEWHVTHSVFLPTEAARDAVERALEHLGLFTSYRDTIDDDERPFWLDVMEPTPPSATEVESRIRRVLEALAAHDGDYNSFSVIGSRDESFPP